MEHYTEQNQETSLFGLGIDPTSKAHLSEAARWAKFLAICGFVSLTLMVIYGIFISFYFSTMMDGLENSPYRSRGMGNIFGVGMAVFYIVCAVIGFFPYFFLFRFASKMKA